MIIYQPSEEGDIMLANAYRNIVQAGDHIRLLGHECHRLGTFMLLLQPPNFALLEVNETIGVWFLAWVCPTFQGAFYSQWCHESMRHSRKMVAASLRAWTLCLEQWPILLGITRQPKLLKEHFKMGYEQLCIIPKFWDDEDTYLLMLTRKNFAPVKERYKKLLETT